MAFDEHLAMRIRDSMRHLEDVEEKRMMGGLVFMVDGKMCVGIIKDELMCRIDPDRHAEVVEMNGCRTMDFTHRPMLGYILVEPAALRTTKELTSWIKLALDYNPKAKASKKR
jgi:TfoX/Sxy family transcriptional regulator of competence genes